MLWTIASFPKCRHHIFLSHCAEDRDTLIHPVSRGLAKRGIVPWFDRHHYPSGRLPLGSLQDGILISRHVVFFITDWMLTQSRGWCAQELVLASLLQDNLIHPGTSSLTDIIFPLLFVRGSDPRLQRSVWQVCLSKAEYCPADATPQFWAVERIAKFLNEQQAKTGEWSRHLRRDPAMRDDLNKRLGLLARVARFEPARVPRAKTQAHGTNNVD